MVHRLRASLIGDHTRAINQVRGLLAEYGVVMARGAPRQYSTGGVPRLGRITKRGDRYLRTLLVHGARSEMTRTAQRDDRKSWASRSFPDTSFEYDDAKGGVQWQREHSPGSSS